MNKFLVKTNLKIVATTIGNVFYTIRNYFNSCRNILRNYYKFYSNFIVLHNFIKLPQLFSTKFYVGTLNYLENFLNLLCLKFNYTLIIEFFK